jgi:hypothetical protein
MYCFSIKKIIIYFHIDFIINLYFIFFFCCPFLDVFANQANIVVVFVVCICTKMYNKHTHMNFFLLYFNFQIENLFFYIIKIYY